MVEPARPAGPDAHSTSHRQDVIDIAVTGHAGRPMVVSAGLDATGAGVGRDRDQGEPPPAAPDRHRRPRGRLYRAGRQEADWSLPARTTASPALWDVSNPDKLPTQLRRASRAAPRGGRRRRRVQPRRPLRRQRQRPRSRPLLGCGKEAGSTRSRPDHRGDGDLAVTFTPQGTLVTAAKDRVIRVYKLGDRGAMTTTVMEHRGGAVDAYRRLRRRLARGVRQRWLAARPGQPRRTNAPSARSQTAGNSARFATLAEFGPDDAIVSDRLAARRTARAN